MNSRHSQFKYSLKKLSGLEQKLYFLLEAEERRVVDAEAAVGLLGISKEHAYVLLRNMYLKGALDKVKSNLYVRYPPSILHHKGKYVEDPTIISKYVIRPYFISHYTALSIHGLAEHVSKYYYLTSTKQLDAIDYHGNVIRVVAVIPLRFFGYEKKKYGSGELNVSDLERTILDVIDRPEYCGGYEEVIRSLANLEGVDWEKLLGYIKKFNKKVLVHRTGYIFDLLKDSIPVPPGFLKRLKRMLSGNVYYFDTREGTYIKEWNVIVNPNLQKVAQ